MIIDEDKNIRSLADLLSDTAQSLEGTHTKLDKLLLAFHERGIAMVLLFFSLPMALPIPVPPGINILLATPLLFLTFQQAYGAKKIFLPSKIREKSFETKAIKGLFQKLVPWMKKLEFFVKPRLGFLTQDFASKFFGLCGFIMALSICIPLPLTNTVPSFGIALMSIGFIMRDGLAILAGAFIGLLWVSILVAGVVLWGPDAFEIIKDAIKSLI